MKILVVGCGTVVRLFYKPALVELLRLGEAEVVGVVDPNLSSARELGEFFDAQVFDSLSKGLRLFPDVSIIATPPGLHRTQVEDALSTGSAVLCEKPLANNVGEAVSMNDRAVSCQKVLAVGHYKRFFPAAEQLYHMIQSESFGSLRSIDLQEGGKFNWPIKNDSFFCKEFTPGGVLFDIGIHALDLLIWWLGEPVLEKYEDDSTDGLEANAKLRLKWPEQDCTARLFFSRDWKTRNEWIFNFERATVHWSVNDANHLSVNLLDDCPYKFYCGLKGRGGIPSRSHPQSFTAHLLHVLDTVRGEDSLRTSVADSISALRLIEACYSGVTSDMGGK